MMGTRPWIVVGMWLVGCQPSAPPGDVRADADVDRAGIVRRVHAAPPSTSCKPEAPVAIDLTARALGGGELEITVRATPTRDATSLEISLVMPPQARAIGASATRWQATPAGDARVMATRVHVDPSAAGSMAITAIARVPVDDIVMARTVTIDLGPPAPAPRSTTYALPDGERAREVTP